MKRLFFDLETSPNKGYFWRSGYKEQISWDSITDERQIICAAWAWNNGTIQAQAWDYGRKDAKDLSIVRRFTTLFAEADEVVGHWAGRFDCPWLRTRAIFHRIILPDVPVVDTCQLAKRKLFLNSSCLDYLGKYLEHKRKIKTEFSWWVKIMEGDADVLEKMVRYNKRDVVLLRQVYRRLEPYCKPGSHAGVADGRPRWSCPSCGSLRVKIDKRNATSAGVVRFQFECNHCHRFFTVSDFVKRQYDEAKGSK